MTDFILLGSKITADGDCSHEIKRCLLLGRKVMTNLGMWNPWACLQNTITKSRNPDRRGNQRGDVSLWESESEVAQSCPTLWDPLDCSPPGSSTHGVFPGKSTGVGCHFLLHSRPRQHIKKQRHYFADIGPSSQSYGFSSSRVWIWELDYKESKELMLLNCSVGEDSWESLGLQEDPTSPS